MLVIPLDAVPSQTLNVLLAGQNVTLNVYQKTTGLFMDVSLQNAPIVTTRICRDRNPIIVQPYLGFPGELFFKDLQGQSHPQYAGLGTRYILGFQVFGE